MVTLCLRVPYSHFFLWKLPNGLEKTGAWEGKNERRQPAEGQGSAYGVASDRVYTCTQLPAVPVSSYLAFSSLLP